MTDSSQGELWPQLDISVRPWAQPQTPGDAGQALGGGMDDTLGRYADAIAKIESAGSGGYSALGPQTKSGDRAYGRYQVMGANVPEWTREALGRALTPEEFLASPKAQDAVFRHKFGSYVAQYGSPADAASAWLTGRPLAAGGANAKDQLGTSGADYARKFLANLSGSEGGGIAGLPGQPATGNLLANMPQARSAGVVDQLLGLGIPRYQLWPERMAREALAAPHQALESGFVPGSQDEIAAAQAIANFAGGGALPLAERGALGALGGRLTQVRGPAEAAAGATAPVFYSTAAQTLQNAGFNKASPAQWLAYLRNAQGVKGEELEWTGLGDRLANSAEPMLSKDELLGHLAENNVQLQEVPKREATGLNDQERLDSSGGSAEYPSYSLPGAEPGSYREALLQLPQVGTRPGGGVLATEGPFAGVETAPNPMPAYHSSHWDEPNVLGHVRMNDRQVSISGESKPLSALFLEELQSDWHQQGRREGYRGAAIGDEDALKEAKLFSQAIGSDWDKLPADYQKELIEQARQKLERSSAGVPDAPFRSTWPELLLKRMIREAAESGKDALAWTSGETQAARYDLSKQVKDIAASREDDGKYTISGLDLRVGGEGMLKFYDDMLPKVAQKLAKKYGGNVELGSTEAGPKQTHGGGYSGELIMEELGREGRQARGIPEDEAGRNEWFRNLTSEQRNKLFEDYASTKNSVPVHVLRLTPELRRAALSQGFPLFSAGVPLSIVGHDGAKRTLHPIEHDPFEQKLLAGDAT